MFLVAISFYDRLILIDVFAIVYFVPIKQFIRADYKVFEPISVGLCENGNCYENYAMLFDKEYKFDFFVV